MSICSIHRKYNKDCKACNTHPRDLFPEGDWEEMTARAEAAGTTNCKACGFEYYLTIDYCPLCSEPFNVCTN